MKIVLVSPSQKFLSNPKMAEPIGLMYLEGVLDNLGIENEMVDLSFDKIIPEADVYFFTGATIHYNNTVKLLSTLSKESIKVLGGSHASALPEECLKDFDIVVKGPGELVIQKILNNIKEKTIYYSKNENLNLIPIPKRKIWNRIQYETYMDGVKSCSLMASRGCPYKCAFCASNVIWGRDVVFRDPDSIFDEIKYLKDTYGTKHYKFIDDIFPFNKKFFKNVSEKISQLDIKWFCESRVDSITDYMLDVMVNNGGTFINLGIESVEQKVLDSISKKLNIEDAKKVIKKIKDKGLGVKLFLISGLPFESDNIVENTISFIKETQPTKVSLFTLVPYPGTDIWKNPKKYNIKQFNSNYDNYQHSVGKNKEEFSWMPTVEYNDRDSFLLREQRNKLKSFTEEWNKK